MSFGEEVLIGWLMHNPECRLEGAFLLPSSLQGGVGEIRSQNELGVNI